MAKANKKQSIRLRDKPFDFFPRPYTAGNRKRQKQIKRMPSLLQKQRMEARNASASIFFVLKAACFFFSKNRKA